MTRKQNVVIIVVNKIRAIERVSYAEAVKKVERSSISEGLTAVKTGRPTLQPEYHRQDPEIVHVKKVDWFFTISINHTNCTSTK